MQIGGSLRDGETYQKDRDPYRDDVVAHAPISSSRGCNDALDAAHKARKVIAAMPGYERAALLRRIADNVATRLARPNFAGKQLFMLLFLLPMVVPPIILGIPPATVLYQAGLAGTMSGVVIANQVPAVTFVVLVMIPFIEQIDPRIEAAARVFGANTRRLFIQVLLPVLLPGVLAALLLVLVRTLAMFELTFLTGGPTSQTLVVALYYAVCASGVRAAQLIDAMAVIYMATILVWLVIALRFASPTPIVSRAKQNSGH
jgi:putative spermidine/putrescine transport system permease protein